MRYCTRKDVHVDRCACAWLIKRFLDPDAEFVFVGDQTPAPDTVAFDMHGVAWGHRGDHCSFETIVVLHGLDEDDAPMRQLARIIHGADITADADETLESAGIDLLFRGVRRVSASDDEALERGYAIMDALYAALNAEQRRSEGIG